jgi:hypothetical protein
MNELRPRGRELIAAARLERTPSTRERQRVLGALMASATLTSTASAVAAPSLLRKLALGAGKWWIMAGMGATLVTGAHFVISARSSTATAIPRSAPVPRTPAPKPPEALVPLRPGVAEPAPPTSATRPSGANPLPPPRRAAAAPTLEQELLGLHAAHAAYRSSQPAQALALVAKHKLSFPQSQLAVERSTLEILSLCGVGQRQQAKQLAKKLRGARGAAALSGLEGSCAADASE